MNLDSDIKVIADRMWRIHPKDIDAMGLKNRTEYYEKELKEFAQAVAKECASICRESGVMLDVSLWLSSTKKEMTEYTALGLAKNIEEKFGVE